MNGIESDIPRVEDLQNGGPYGHLIGVWRRIKRVSSGKQDRIQIEYNNRLLTMKVLED